MTPSVDLDRIFDAQYAAVDLFTDRIPENRAFADAVAEHLMRTVEGRAVMSDQVRRNVIVFYGIGGIGKSALSQRLERWLLGAVPAATQWGPSPLFDQSVCTARVEFHGSRVVDTPGVLMSIRAALAGGGRRFAAFDLGFAAWWALARPGVALPALTNSRGVDVREQIVDTLGSVVDGAAGGFGLGPLSVRMAVRLVDAIRHRRLRDRLLRECEPLVSIVDQAGRDPSPAVASSLAGLLSWDLDQLVTGERPLTVVFADATEYIQGGDRLQESLLNRIVYLTPAILWVVTTQRTLEWADPTLRGILPKAGPQTWPGLALGPAESRQHLLGDLSDADVLRYLAEASGSGGNPVLSAEVVDRIRRGAHGLPLYLDLSMSIARSSGSTPLAPEQFGGPLPALVTRVLSDLPEEERDIARTASLLSRFDPTLVAKASGRLEGDAQRFCRRSLVRKDEHPRFPYRLHDAVRSALADETIANRGAWTIGDRLARVRLLLEAVRERHDAVLYDIEYRLDLLQLAASLCAEYDMEVSWVRKALFELPGMGRTADRLPPPDSHTWMGQLSLFFEAWRGRTTGERIAYLEDLQNAPLRPDIARTARLFLAYASRGRSDAERALVILRGLLHEEPDSSRLRYQVGRTLHMLGRYYEWEDLLRQSPPDEPTELERLRSDMDFDRGHLMRSIQGVAARAAHLYSEGRHRVGLENETVAVWRRALAGRVTIAECDELIKRADLYGLRLSMRTFLAAKAVCLAGDDSAVSSTLIEAESIIRAGSGYVGWREWTAGLLHGLRVSDAERIAAIRRQWDDKPPQPTPNYRVVDRVFQYAGYAPTFPALDGDAESRETTRRWNEIIRTIVERA